MWKKSNQLWAIAGKFAFYEILEIAELSETLEIAELSEILDCELYQITTIGYPVISNLPVAILDRPAFAATSSSRFHTTTCKTSALTNQNRFIENISLAWGAYRNSRVILV